MKNKNFLKLIIALIVPQIFAITGSLLTNMSSNSWYSSLEKPFYTPPNWMFQPVWLALYVLIGLSAFLVWKKGLERKEVKFALLIFVFQMSLNLFWFFIFFTLENSAIAFTEIISLLFAILATSLAFYQISKPAAFLLLPYIIWVVFMAFFNYNIWMSNINAKIEIPVIQNTASSTENFDNNLVITDETLIELNLDE